MLYAFTFANCDKLKLCPLTDQAPVPIVGLFPESVAGTFAQIVCVDPFVADVGD